MSALAVTGVSLLTAFGLGVLAVESILLDPQAFGFGLTKEQQAEKQRRDAVIAVVVLGSVIGAGALLTYKTTHTNIGKGLMFGGGGVAGLIAFDMVFPKTTLARKE